MRAQGRARLSCISLAAVAAALAAVLGGCTGGSGGGPATDGPLTGGAFGSISRGEDGVTGRLGQRFTFGVERFTNHGGATVVLDRVVLLHPHNERLIGSYAVPGILFVGTTTNWPPKYPGTPAVPGVPSAWKHRQSVHGFRLAPGKSFNMVLGVTATAPGRASSRGLAIYYHYGAHSYVISNHLAMTIEVTTHGG